MSVKVTDVKPMPKTEPVKEYCVEAFVVIRANSEDEVLRNFTALMNYGKTYEGNVVKYQVGDITDISDIKTTVNLFKEYV